MRFLVVLFAVVAVALGAPSVEKRSIGHAVAYSFPTAVSHQSRVDVHSSPAVVAETVVAEPVVAAYAAPAVAPVAYAAPAATVYAGGSAVSHQSRVDVHTSPAVVAAAPVVEARAVYSPSVYSPSVYSPSVYSPYVNAAPAVYAAPAAVSHQSRVDVHSSPAVVQSVAYPTVVEARSAWAPAVYSAW